MNDSTGTAVPSIVYEALRSSGQPLHAATRDSAESRFGEDFTEVRVHTDARATESARAIHASAYTLGQDIYFDSQQFRPGTSTGDRLIAHELAHVAQQRAGGGMQRNAVGVSNESDVAEGRAHAAADAVASGRPLPDIGTTDDAVIHRAVDTNGGTFDFAAGTQPIHAPTGAVGEMVGAHMFLEFTAGNSVESRKIGLIQSTKAMSSSVAGGPLDRIVTQTGDPDEGQLIMGVGQADPGREIDVGVHPPESSSSSLRRAKPSTSPVYGVGYRTGGLEKTLSEGNPEVGSSQWGSHERDPVTHLFQPAKPARIQDEPWRIIMSAGQTYEHSFEVAALAIEGPIAVNTYLGSVSWGWSSDAAGQVTIAYPALVKAGAPSAAFMGAAKLWNDAVLHDTGTGVTAASVDIPITSLDSGTMPPSSRSTPDLVFQISEVDTALASMPPGPNKTNKEFEKKALEYELARRVQKMAAAHLSTPAVIKRAKALPAEISGMATDSARIGKEQEQEAVREEITKRKLLITVHVHETEDITGPDSVYVNAVSGSRTSTSVVDLNDGQEHTFVVPLSELSPARSPSLLITVYDKDVEGDDLMFDKQWAWSSLPAEETQSRDGGKYTVRSDFTQL